MLLSYQLHKENKASMSNIILNINLDFFFFTKAAFDLLPEEKQKNRGDRLYSINQQNILQFSIPM